jgi:hypothetical protein
MLYASDVVDEGVDHVLGVAVDRAGVDALEFAAIYHHGRDLYPHNPRRKLIFLDGGACFFRPDLRNFADQRIQPHLARMLTEVDPLRELLRAGQACGVGVRAWTINLHNLTLGEAYPDCAARNVFGDPLLTDLCPANPDARAYVRTASAELAGAGVDAVVAESICYMPFEHGFHHERNPYQLSPTVRYFLSVCFCDHCRRAVATEAVGTIDRLAAFVRDELTRALAGMPTVLDDTPLERPAVAALLDGEMAALLAARESVVTSLVEEVTAAVEVAGPTQFVFMDSMGADDAGDQAGQLVVDRSWRFGVDVATVAHASHGLSIMGYSRSDERFRADVDAYRPVLPDETPLSLVLRAMPPDCLDPLELEPKVAYARALDIEWLEFYVYGLMRQDALDWIRRALAA